MELQDLDQTADARTAMPNVFRRWLSKLIPSGIEINSEPYLRAEAFVFLVLCGVVLTAILCVFELSRGVYDSALIMASIMSMAGLVVWLFKRDWHRNKVQIFFFVVLVTGMTVDATFKSGFYTNDVSWLMLAALLGGLIWGARGALIWGAICLLITTGFLVAHVMGAFTPPDTASQLANNATTAFSLIIIGTLFMIIVQNWFSQAHQRRELAMSALAQQNKALSDAIARQEQLEQHMIHSQKQESLGLLAGGVAHDFNNLLFGVTAELELALLDMGDTEEAEASIRAALLASRKASDLTRLLLTYAGKRPVDRHEHRLSHILTPVIQLARSTLPRTMRLHDGLEDCDEIIHCDATQLEQVFLNLLINAGDACEGQGQVSVTREVRHITPEELAREHTTNALEPGQYVCVSIEDNGCGMDEATQKRIFEPFFTTKFTGRGLGLAVTEGILRAHKGAITLRSAPGEGTCFTVILPKHQGTPQTQLATIEPLVSMVQNPDTLVLLIDDEITVRESLTRQLQRLGIGVLSATGGMEGLELFGDLQKRLSGIILDLTMPDLSGEEVLGELRQYNATLPVLLVSGYSADDVTQILDRDPHTHFLSKPFGLEELSQSMDWMLGTDSLNPS